MNIQSPQQAPSQVQQFSLGLGLGLIPSVPVLITLLTNAPFGWPFFAGLLLYPIELIATIVTLCIKRVRAVGFGLLMMVLISPLMVLIGGFLDLVLHPLGFNPYFFTLLHPLTRLPILFIMP